MGSLGSNPGVSANSRNRMVGKKQIVLTELQIREAVSYISDCTCRLLLYGGLTRPAVSLVLKTSGARDGMGIDTSALRHICRERGPPFFDIGSVDVLTLTVLAAFNIFI